MGRAGRRQRCSWPCGPARHAARRSFTVANTGPLALSFEQWVALLLPYGSSISSAASCKAYRRGAALLPPGVSAARHRRCGKLNRAHSGALSRATSPGVATISAAPAARACVSRRRRLHKRGEAAASSVRGKRRPCSSSRSRSPSSPAARAVRAKTASTGLQDDTAVKRPASSRWPARCRAASRRGPRIASSAATSVMRSGGGLGIRRHRRTRSRQRLQGFISTAVNKLRAFQRALPPGRLTLYAVDPRVSNHALQQIPYSRLQRSAADLRDL